MQWNAIPASIAPELQENRAKPIVFALGIVISLLHIYFNLFASVSVLSQNILHFALFILLCGLLNSLSSNRLLRGLDLVFTLAVSLAAVYLIVAEDLIYQRGLRLVWSDWLAGVLVVLGAIEMTRRATGLIIPILICLALSYLAWWGKYVPGVFQFKGLSLDTVLFRSLYGDDALFGNIARISASFVFMFILFGAFLLRSGAGDFVIHLSRSIASRMVGGPGVVAIFASGLTGTISGSAVANTASTGVVTIPLMKNAGFSPRFAAAVEASASTGGQIVPPIMGAGAFVMASYTQIPYSTIVTVSILPAVLYFISLIFYVRTESYKCGITKPMGQAESIWPMVFKEGLSFVVPVLSLIVMLVLGYTPTYAAGIAIVLVVVSSWFTPTKMGFSAIADALALGARNMIVTAVLLCAVGLVVNVIATAGIGNTFSLMITDWSGGSLLIALLLVAVASLILGMGLPVTASYIVLATLSAPALLQLMANAEILSALTQNPLSQELQAMLMLVGVEAQEGVLTHAQALSFMNQLPDEMTAMLRDSLVDETRLSMLLLSAHLIIFWLSQDSNVTPPVCLCTFTAAAIAKSPPMATGFTSWKVAKALYIVPLLIAYTPLVQGSWLEALQVCLFAIPGLFAFTLAMQGWYKQQLTWIERILMFGLCAVLLSPFVLWWQLGALAGLVAWSALRSRAARLQAA